MRGYWNAGDATRETINSDGWLATGDIGSLDADGFLSITDRKKEIMVTAQGKNVAPQPLENALKRQPLIGQVAVVGDRRPYLVALVVPDFDMLRRLAARLGIGEQPLPEQLAHAGVLEAVEAQIQAATVAFAHHEQIRRFHLLDREFSPEQDELTPTLKLKRRVIGEHFAEVIDTLYSGHEAPAVIGS